MTESSQEKFRAFDFEGDKRWQQYKSSLEIPAGKNIDQVITRLKAKWYQREVDSNFDVATAQNRGSSEQPQSVPHNGEAHRSTPSHSDHHPSPEAGNGLVSKVLKILASNSEVRSSAVAQKNTNGAEENRQIVLQERLFFLHLALVAFSVLHLQPLSRAWSRQGWLYFLQTALLTHIYKVYCKFGAPKLWPFSLAAIRQWMVPATASTDFQYALICLFFMASKPVLLVVVPILVLAVYHIFAYGAKHFSSTGLWQSYGSRAHQWLVARQQQALMYNAASEIGTGFLVIFNLLAPPRSFFLVFMYWQFLRMRFWSPDAASYHRMVWAKIDESFGKYLNYIPILKVPIGYVQRWFQSGPGR